MRVWNVQIEKEKIDHVPIKKAIGKISQDAGEQKCQRDITPNIACSPPQEETRTTTSATDEITMKKVLLPLKDPNAAPVLVTLTRLKKSGDHERAAHQGLMNRRTICLVH